MPLSKEAETKRLAILFVICPVKEQKQSLQFISFACVF